ncbi:TolC family protein [Polyangium jinanense]|uniref:TolC family protein n=1 Tax=Polyangium jinanense TaxID=2829994 RepID=A0A9X4AZ78_9BACT|nr:TolC family protein [Polyangium jinanense]MDC3960240.1 TolC family protein [Polyangium jinanense]MDC3988040.1 TolC family protein [Polyangium jinanense]
MNRTSKWCVAVCSLALALSSADASAQQVPASGATRGSSPVVHEITENDVVTLVLRHNPDVASAILSEKQAAALVRAQEVRYPFVLTANGGYTHSASPTLQRDGSVSVGERDVFALNAALRKDFATGTVVSFSVQSSRSSTSNPVGELVTAGAAGTGYSVSTRLSLTQPILRGAGTRMGEAGLRAAELDRTAAHEGRERVASEVVRDALTSYWELWYASRALAIEQAANALAKVERDAADQRREKGAAAAVDVLSYETRIATLGESVTSAELTEIQRGLELAQLLAVIDPNARLRASGDPVDPPVPTVAEVEKALASLSPELKELEARVASAESRAQVAGDQYRPRFDVEGYVELRGLGNGSIAPAFAQIGTFGAVNGYVGFLFEAPLTTARESAEVENARINAQISKNQLEAARSRIRIVALRLVAQLESAEARRRAAAQTVAIAEKQLEAERARFALGTSTPLQVQQAEDTVRTSRLRVARATVDRIQAMLQLDHSMGRIAARVGGGSTPEK